MRPSPDIRRARPHTLPILQPNAAWPFEIANPQAVRGEFHFALFDFDGTLSLIREGWRDVMIPFFTEQIAEAEGAEDRADIERTVRDFVEQLTGKQTIYQCFQLVEEIEKRGGRPRSPLEYKHEYLDRLWERIKDRVAGLKSGRTERDSLLLPGSRMFLERLRDRGVALFLASGTDLAFVEDEARALRIDTFFGPHIYGALDQYQLFSKQLIIDRILEQNGLRGSELLVVGDGYVEIENGKAAGGLTLGVASNESDPGIIDDWKRQRLLDAGADVIVPDFQETERLMEFLFAGVEGSAGRPV